MKFIPSVLKTAIVVGLSFTLFACGSTDSEETVEEASVPAVVAPPPPPADPAPQPPPPEEPTPPPPPPEEPAPPPPPPEEPAPPTPPEEQVLFEEDIAKDIRQSTPTDVNIPLGIQATLDVEYLGAFRVEAGGQSSSDYAVGTLGFNPDNNSIFVAGHGNDKAVAEFEIPDELSLSENPQEVVLANVFQDFVTLLDKKSEGNQTNAINGLLYYKENLIVTSEIWYDGSGSNRDNLQIFSVANDLSSSSYKGMLQLEGAALAAGYMSKVPDDLVETIGGEYIVGWASNYSITSRYSQGPSIYVIAPQEVVDITPTVSREVESSMLMSFPLEEGKTLVPDGEKYLDDISPIWGPVAKAKYGFIIPGTSIFMALGSHAGIHSGVGYKIVQDDGRLCGGPCPHSAADVYNYFWLFDVNDIVNAPNPWEVQPISYGKWSHPYDNNGHRMMLGATYDDYSNTLYLSIDSAGQVANYDRPPMILAYKVKSKS